MHRRIFLPDGDNPKLEDHRKQRIWRGHFGKRSLLNDISAKFRKAFGAAAGVGRHRVHPCGVSETSPRVRRWLFAAVTSGLAVIASCTDGTSQFSNGGEPSPAPAITTDETPNAFEAFFWPDNADPRAQSLRLDDAIGDCMRAQGFDYVSLLLPDTTEPAPAEAHRGFGQVDSLLGVVEPATNAPATALVAYLDTLSFAERSAYEFALFGDPDDPASKAASCQESANVEVMAAIPRHQEAYQKILDEYYGRLKTDPAMVAAEKSYATCLEESTSMLAATNSPLVLRRNNVEYAVRAQIAAQLGRSVRWITQADADRLGPGTLPPPYEVSIDETGIGIVLSGPITRNDPATVEAAYAQEQEIFDESERCWAASGGPNRTAELQEEAMRQAEPIIASQSPAG